MATSSIVSTLGAGSGIDVKSLAQSLVDAEKTPRKERIDAKIAQTEAKITGHGAIKFALSELKNAFGKLNDASDFTSIKSNNTQPSAFGVTTSSEAASGSFSIDVLQTARAQRSVSGSFLARDTPLNTNKPSPGGNPFSLRLTVGGVDKGSIPVTTATPAGMVSAINDAKLGVTAQLINTGSGFTVVLTGETGANQSFTMSSDDGTVASPGTPVAVADVDFGSTPLQTAANARLMVNGLEVTRTSNTITDVIDGVTLDLYANTTGAARLDLNRDTAGIKDNVKGLVKAYNDFEETLKILGDKSSEVEDFGGALAGESLLRSVRSQVRALISNTSSTPGTTIKAARDVGLSFDRFGKLTLDEGKLETALTDNFTEVSTMFSAGTNNQSLFSPLPAGLAGSAVNSIEKMLLSTGLIDSNTRSATAQIAKYKEDLAVLEERMEKLMTRYMSQFSVMESIVGSSNSMRESLKGSFEGLMQAYKN
jgi:flagellar hook-associated protein 2